MNRNLGRARLRTIQFIVLVFAVFFLATFVTPTSAITNAQSGKSNPAMQTVEGIRRLEMMNIAERYVRYKWVAASESNAAGSSNVTPPEMAWCLTHQSPSSTPWGCWRLSATTADPNVGVPYFWGGSTAVEDDPNDDFPIDLYLVPHDKYAGAGYFKQKLEAGAPAGDVKPDYDDNGQQNVGAGAGVDCVGFVGHVWRRGSRLYLPQISDPTAHNELGRPIRFKDLQAGDVLKRYKKDGLDHIIVFKEWLNYTPGSGDPVPAGTNYGATGGTTFKVYEAALGPKKVVESVYMLLASEPVMLPFRRGHMQETDKVAIRRLEYCDHEYRPADIPAGIPTHFECEQDVEFAEGDNKRNQYFDYYPSTYFNPIDVVLVIDGSGSMSTIDPGSTQTRMQIATEAAKMFIDLMKPGDKIGIVLFSDSAQVLHQLDVIDSEAEKAEVKQLLNDLPAVGGTALGQGIVAGHLQLNSYGAGDPNRSMLLLSDGDENICPCWRDVMPPQYGFDPINSIGLGTSYNEALLSWISARTDGVYRSTYPYNSTTVKEIFNTLYMQTNGEIVVQTASGTVAAGQTVQPTVTVASVSSMTVSLFWPGSDLDLVLVKPDGQEITPAVADADRDITYTTGSSYEYYTVFAPEPGQWGLKIHGTSVSGTQEDYFATVTADDGMILAVNSDKERYFVGNPIKITASVQDGSFTDPLGVENLRGALIQAMEVTARDPAHNEFSFQLYDDGLHGDDEANDGVFANTFCDPNPSSPSTCLKTSLEGNYTFDVKISGTTNWTGAAFVREKTLSVMVTDPPHVASIVRASVNPDNYYNATELDYIVSFSEYVSYVQVKDFALTTQGVSGAFVKSVDYINYSGQYYKVTVNTGTGNGTIRLDVVDDDTLIDLDTNPLGDVGPGNGNFTTGEVYTIDRSTRSTIVTKLADTNDGLCNSADCSLREAIAAAAPGETITFAPSLSGGVIRLGSTLVISKSITIDGSMLATPITINGDPDNDGYGNVRVFYINSGFTVTLNDLTITKGQGDGGGVYNNNSSLTILNSTFSGNNGTSGGAIYGNFGMLTIASSTFSANTGHWGGAVYTAGIFNTVTISNSTFSGNTAGYQGGGISTESIATINNSTFSGNSAIMGAGIYSTYSPLSIANTIVANSVTGQDCFKDGGAISMNVNNLIEDGSCAAPLSGDPTLGPLANNGGRTQTMALLPGSPAIDAGDDAVCAEAPVNNIDQRGTLRPQGAHCDIGAYEESIPAVVSVSRVSVSTAGVEGNVDSYSSPASVSADGRYVSFSSSASNLVSGDTNGEIDIFLRDRQTNITSRISVASDGTQGNGQSYTHAMSADGRFIAFVSQASNLVAGDTNAKPDIFVRDMQTNTTTRVSVATDGTQGNNAPNDLVEISDDGRYVVFASFATNLVSGDTNGVPDIFLRDTQTNTTTRISVATDGTQANGGSTIAAISASGRFIAFTSSASNLVSGDTNGTTDLFLRDTQTNTTTRVSIASDGTQGNASISSYLPSVSMDGRYIVFASSASNLVSGDSNGVSDIFMRDRQTNTTSRISVATDGTQSNGSSVDADISADGRYVAFFSLASNLVSGDANGMGDVFLREVLNNTTTLISVTADGTQGNGDTYAPSISDNGKYIVVESQASNFVSGDTNAVADIFLFTTDIAGGSPPVPPTVTPTFTPTATASPLPDLLISQMRIEYQNTNCLLPNDSLGVRVWVTNSGSAAAGSFMVSVNGVQQTVNGLAIGETQTVFFSGYSNPVTAIVDSTNLVTESNESNNSITQSVPVPTQPLPCTPTPTFTPTNTPTFTPTNTATRTNTPTSTPTSTTTGWINPTANAAVTSGSGDNNGFQTNPANAYSDNATFAVDTDSGNNTNTGCTNTGKDRHMFYTYNFSSIPGGSTILGIEVRMDMKVDSTTGAPASCIELSWNGGTTWTAAKTTPSFTTSEATYILGSAGDTWAHPWSTSELSNLRVRITNVASNTSRDFSLDWIPVRITYIPATPTPTFTPTNTATFTPTNTSTSTPTNTATRTNTPTFTATNTPTGTSTPTFTPTRTNTPSTPTATFTSTNTPSPTATQTCASTYTSQPDGTTGVDTYLSSGSPNTAHETNTSVDIGEDNAAVNYYRRTLIRFDLSTIPSNAVICSASLSLTVGSSSGATNDRIVRVYRMKTAWSEQTATWNIASIGVSWQTAGASGVNDRESTDIGSLLVPATAASNTEEQWALDPVRIQEMISGSFTNNGFLLQPDTELDDYHTYRSSDYTTTPSRRPKLVIQYTVPTVTPTPTFTPTNTPTATATPGTGLTYTVSKTNDTNDGTCNADCSLREAIRAANAQSGADTIVIPAGLYTLTIAGSDDTSAAGDLDITDSVTIRGAGATSTIISGSYGWADRIFQVVPTVSKDVTFQDLTIQNGNKNSTGAGISMGVASNLFLTRVIVQYNVSTNVGAGVYANTAGANVTITDSAIINNTAHEAASGTSGGGIYINTGASLILTNSTVSGNESDLSGAGLRINTAASVTITNVTISNNTIPSTITTGNGAGIAISSGGNVTVRNSIIAGNLDNSDVSHYPDCSGTLTSAGHNIIGDNTGCTVTATTGDQIGTSASPINAQLGILTDNGGNTYTHALLANSPAMNAGDTVGCPAADQRGITRSICDIGAFESNGTVFTVNKANDAYDGTCNADCSLRDAIHASNVSVGMDIVVLPAGTYSLSIAGSTYETTGALAPYDPVIIQGAGAGTTTLTTGAGFNDRLFLISMSTSGAPSTISGLTMQNGTKSTSGGGAIYSDSPLTLSSVVLKNNSTTNGKPGGAIEIDNSPLAIYNTAFINNSASGAGANGGALFYYNGASIALQNVTFSGNTADKHGGALYGDTAGKAGLLNVTFSNNTVTNTANADGAAFTAWSSDVIMLRNVISAGNLDQGLSNHPDCSDLGQVGKVVTFGHNLIGNINGCTLTASVGDQFGTSASPIDAQLAAVADNGGGTLTHALLSTSPAINAGDNIGCPTRDQRRYIRDATCDIGAYEYNAVLGRSPGGITVAQNRPAFSNANQFLSAASFNVWIRRE